MNKTHILLLVFISFSIIRSQDVTFYGKAKPGSIVIGKGEQIEAVTLDKEKLQVDNNGIFVFGFDRDAKGTHLLDITFKNGKVEEHEFKDGKKVK